MRVAFRIFMMGLAAILFVGWFAGPSDAGHTLDTNGGTPFHYPAFSWGQQITVVDRTSPWPVSTATSNWNSAFHPGLVHYHWWNCSHGVNCVQVNEINSSSSLYLGAAIIYFNNSTGHVLTSTYIELNNNYLGSECIEKYTLTAYTCRRHIACQEIGHVLGLDHQTGGSCLDDTLSKNAHSKVTPEYSNSGHDDHDSLHTAYDHGYH